MAQSKTVRSTIAAAAPTPAHVLTAALGMGTTAAGELVGKLSDESQAKLVRIYTSNSTDKAARIRSLLPTN